MHSATSRKACRTITCILTLALAALFVACGDTTVENGSRDTGNATDTTGGDANDDTVGSSDTSADDTSGSDTSAQDTSAQDTSGPQDTTGGDTATASDYRIDPATQTITLEPGEQRQIAYTLYRTDAGGTEQQVTPDAWDATPATLATMDAAGSLTTTGVSGGAVTIEATVAGSIVAEATLNIELTWTDLEGNDPSVTDLFPPNGTEGSDPAQAPGFVYPYPNTVLPSGVYPPVLQWEAPYAGSGDALFRILLERGPVQVEIVTDGAGVPECPSNLADGRCYQVTVDQWRVLAEAAATEDITVKMWGRSDQDTNNPSYPATELPLRLVPANLAGKVYYYYVTESNSGAIQQIDVELSEQRPTNTRVLTNEGRCHGCHALSRDGRRLATEIESGTWPGWGGAVLDIDDAADASQWLARPDDGKDWKGVAYAFNPDGTKLLGAWVDENQSNRTQLTLYDLDTLTDADVQLDATHPAWSPDGGLVAYTNVGAIGGENEDPRIDVADSDLYRMTASEQPDGSIQWGTPEQVVDGNGEAISWPTFSPDSRRLAFSQGQLARLAEHNSGTLQENTLFIIDAQASPGTAPVQLRQASRRVGPNGERYDLQPVFSPFQTASSDGSERFYWMLFQSVRPYGVVNPNLGTHQLWVSAVRTSDLSSGSDPSRPAFYLPGQDPNTNNVMGFWAANPCGKSYSDGSADSCTLTSECCAGYVCNASGVCEQQDEMCVKQGNSCETSAECCEGFECLENTAGDKVCFYNVN